MSHEYSCKQLQHYLRPLLRPFPDGTEHIRNKQLIPALTAFPYLRIKWKCSLFIITMGALKTRQRLRTALPLLINQPFQCFHWLAIQRCIFHGLKRSSLSRHHKPTYSVFVHAEAETRSHDKCRFAHQIPQRKWMRCFFINLR